MPNASCKRPVWPSAPISAGPAAPERTARTGASASGTVTSVIRASGRAATMATAMANGTSAHPVYSARVRASPSMTASVRLPATVSDGMSRRLLITSSAQASRPTGNAATTPSQGSERISTYVVPATAARPKNTNTAISPKPWYPYGCCPPV